MSGLDPDERDRWRGRVAAALEALDVARDRSPLPEEPTTTAAIDAFLVDLRRRSLA